MNKGSEMSQPTRVGGPILAASATLRIFGKALDPNEITGLLGLPPTASYRAGDPVSVRVVAHRKIGMWQLESSLSPTEELSLHVLGLLTQLPMDTGIWEAIVGRFSADVYCGVDVRLPNSGIELTSAAIAALAARKLSIQLDLYALPAVQNGSDD